MLELEGLRGTRVSWKYEGTEGTSLGEVKTPIVRPA